MKGDRLKIRYGILAFGLCLILLYLQTGLEGPGYSFRDLRCINYLVWGTLYGGQPECVQPPMMYFSGAFFALFGESMVQPASVLAIWILNSLAAYILLNMIGSKDLIHQALAVATYCLFIQSSLAYHLDSSLAMFFIMAGSYILYFSSSDEEDLVGSGVLALSLASKVPAVSAVAGLFVAYVLRGYRREKDAGIVPFLKANLLRRSLLFFSPIACVCLILGFVFPNIFVYTILSHMHTEALDTSGAVNVFVTTNPLFSFDLAAFLAMVVFALAFYLKDGDFMAAAYLVSHPLAFIYRIKPGGSIPDVFGSYYTIYPVAFFFLLFFKKMGELENKRVYAVAFIAFAVVVSPFELQHIGSFSDNAVKLTESYTLQKQRLDYSRGLFDKAYDLLPKPEKRALFNSQIVDVLRDYPIELFDERDNPPSQEKYIDTAFYTGLKEWGVLKYDALGVYPSEKELSENISAGAYDIVAVGPKSWDTHIYYALSISNKSVLGDYCTVFVPYFTESKNERYWSTVMIKGDERCRRFLKDVDDYFVGVFDSVCEFDEWSANNNIRWVILHNSQNLTPEGGLDIKRHFCATETQGLTDYEGLKKTYWVRMPALLAFVVFSFYSFRKLNRR